MYMKLDEEVERLLCCSFCKSDLVRNTECFSCKSCGLKFPRRAVKTDENEKEYVFDFRILRPPYCVPEGFESWSDIQSEYEQFHEKNVKGDSLQRYLDEIDSVREIYAVEYQIEGKVLDVGGHQGRLRHYLGTEVSLYVSIDPFIGIFSGIKFQPNLLRAYPSLSEPCNFISAHAEYLPFKSDSFDWIHMRSVVDHLADPYLAFLEAYRCSTIGGRLLVGLAILEAKEKPKQNGVLALYRRIAKGLRNLTTLMSFSGRSDDHMFRLTHGTLKDLFEKTGWDVTKEHWQKPPFQFCIYACGQKRETIPPP